MRIQSIYIYIYMHIYIPPPRWSNKWRVFLGFCTNLALYGLLLWKEATGQVGGYVSVKCWPFHSTVDHCGYTLRYRLHRDEDLQCAQSIKIYTLHTTEQWPPKTRLEPTSWPLRGYLTHIITHFPEQFRANANISTCIYRFVLPLHTVWGKT